MHVLMSRAEYEEKMKNGLNRTCLLCDPNQQILLGASKYWLWIANIAPYWRYHTMLVSKKHIEDLIEVSAEQFLDLQKFYSLIKKHLLSKKLRRANGKPLDQFLLMLRVRESDIPDGSTYPKPTHLHIHLVPDRGGVDNFKIDETAKEVDVKSIALE